MLFRQNQLILRILIFRSESKAIGFAFWVKSTDFEISHLLAKCKVTGFALSVKSADFENPHFSPKSKAIGFAFLVKSAD